LLGLGLAWPQALLVGSPYLPYLPFSTT
jgi:hypothetical protein